MCINVPSSVLWYDVRYDFRIESMFGSSLPPDVCMSYLRYLCLFAYRGVQHIKSSVCFVYLCFVYISGQFLWIVHVLLLLRRSLTFIVKTGGVETQSAIRVIIQIIWSYPDSKFFGIKKKVKGLKRIYFHMNAKINNVDIWFRSHFCNNIHHVPGHHKLQM